jgi:ribosomal protein S18 acetylase RimI-like enzyme
VAGRGGATSQPDVIRILAIAVHPSFQGQGFGPVLLRAATAIDREQGAASLALSVHPKNERALRAYARDGWERVLVDGVFAGSMRKSLRKSAVKMPAISVL